MLYISVEDFYKKARTAKRLSREEEIRCAEKGKAGDAFSRQRIVASYLPTVAAVLRRSPKEIQTLQTVYECIHALEQAVDRFDFTGEGESFAHRLSWVLRQCITSAIAHRP